MIEIASNFSDIKKRFEELSSSVDEEKIKKEIEKYDQMMSTPDFWSDQEKAKSISQKRKALQDKLNTYISLKSRIKDLDEMVSELKEEDLDTTLLISEELEAVEKDLKKFELETYLSDEMDINNAYLTIQAGAGGTEACDWASMLLRMYTRWAEKHGYEVQLTDINPDDVAGIKSATLYIKGPYAYGYLKSENGVHRLVRISPFDANARRHTSFASVLVVPEVSEDVNIEIKEEDLRIDTYRASGAGGQYVNKTDTAVRITHIPTGIVVACQQERSQIQNRRKAMEMLKARLYQLELQKIEEKKKSLEGPKTDIGWGYKIRSYIFQPSQLVKDLRTGEESGNVEAVMDGEIDNFIEAYLKKKALNQLSFENQEDDQ
ncbi:peptide chain release factor 2 [Hydrogenobaculum acidophilum]